MNEKLNFDQWLQTKYNISRTYFENNMYQWAWNRLCEKTVLSGYTKDEWIQSNLDNLNDEYNDYKSK